MWASLQPPLLTFHRDSHVFGSRSSGVDGFASVNAGVLSGHKQRPFHDLLLPRAHATHARRWNPVGHTAKRCFCSLQPRNMFWAAYTVQRWGIWNGFCFFLIN